MTSKELEEILKSPITKGAKGRFISIEQLEQIKTVLEAWEVVKGKEVDLYDVIHTKNYQQYEQENYDLLPQYQLTLKDYETIKKALEAE